MSATDVVEDVEMKEEKVNIDQTTQFCRSEATSTDSVVFVRSHARRYVLSADLQNFFKTTRTHSSSYIENKHVQGHF